MSLDITNIELVGNVDRLTEIGIKSGILVVKYEAVDTLLISEDLRVSAKQLLNKYPERFAGREMEIKSALFEDIIHILIGEASSNFSDDEEKDVGEDIESYLKDNYELLVKNHDAPVIKALNSIIISAIKRGSSDIHIEPQSVGYRIRLRVNGIMEKLVEVERGIANSLINKIKIISGLNIAETLSPQDGQVELTIGKKKINVRVSVVPMYFGEKIVLRLLMEVEKIPTLDDLGFTEHNVALIKKMLSCSNGMVLVTGPTSSGKSTSLHSFIKYINNGEINITTVEDPVEYRSDEINQIPISGNFGVSFNEALRAALRQDPDVIMVGEIRDSETADIAIKASLTGHLVLTTLHTNDAVSAIGRLRDMGVEGYQLRASILGVVAQRLVRTICNSCVNKTGVGCSDCKGTRYAGRKLVGEVILLDDDLRKNMLDEEKLNSTLINSGFKSMKSELGKMLKEGSTSLEEITRIGIGLE